MKQMTMPVRRRRGFSLVEILAALFIVGLLSAIGFKTYRNSVNKVHINWTKAEMIELAKIMNTAKALDGSYHQFIYQMGYRPKGPVYAAVGSAASKTAVCCNKYPAPGADPCRSASLGVDSRGRNVYRGGWTYYSCGNEDLEKSVQNVAICGNTNYSFKCSIKNNAAAFTAGSSSCAIAPAGWCDCDSFTLRGAAPSLAAFTLNHKGVFCKE